MCVDISGVCSYKIQYQERLISNVNFYGAIKCDLYPFHCLVIVMRTICTSNVSIAAADLDSTLRADAEHHENKHKLWIIEFISKRNEEKSTFAVISATIMR